MFAFDGFQLTRRYGCKSHSVRLNKFVHEDIIFRLQLVGISRGTPKLRDGSKERSFVYYYVHDMSV